MFWFELWTVYAIITAVSILIEIMFPTMFCINFALAGLITSVVSLFWGSFYQTLVLFLVLSALFIIFVKPLLIKLLKKDTHTDFNSQYLGKIVPAIEPINTKSQYQFMKKDGKQELKKVAMKLHRVLMSELSAIIA